MRTVEFMCMAYITGLVRPCGPLLGHGRQHSLFASRAAQSPLSGPTIINAHGLLSTLLDIQSPYNFFPVLMSVVSTCVARKF